MPDSLQKTIAVRMTPEVAGENDNAAELERIVDDLNGYEAIDSAQIVGDSKLSTMVNGRDLRETLIASLDRMAGPDGRIDQDPVGIVDEAMARLGFELPDDDPRFYGQDLIDLNIEALRGEVDALDRHEGRLIAIVDEQAGGIIAYAIGEDHTALLVSAANRHAKDNGEAR